MNRTNLVPKLLTLAFLGILVFSFASIVRADNRAPILMKMSTGEYGQPLGYGDISASQPSFTWAGAGYTKEEVAAGYFTRPPYDFRFYINGEEIQLQRFAFYDKDGMIFGVPGLYMYIWYVTFEADYFEPGEYEMKFELLLLKPYIFDPQFGWRVIPAFIWTQTINL